MFFHVLFSSLTSSRGLPWPWYFSLNSKTGPNGFSADRGKPSLAILAEVCCKKGWLGTHETTSWQEPPEVQQKQMQNPLLGTVLGLGLTVRSSSVVEEQMNLRHC